MEKKHELTEKLKAKETEIYDLKLELRAVNAKIENAYSYQNELYKRFEINKANTEKLKKEFFEKSTKMTQLYDDIKNIVDVFTGNYYSI